MATWASLKDVVEAKIPESEPEQAFLMSVMTKLADQDKDTNKMYKVKMSVREWAGAWNCLNSCLHQGDFTRTGVSDKMLRIEALSLIAIEIDKSQLSGIGPLELLK